MKPSSSDQYELEALVEELNRLEARLNKKRLQASYSQDSAAWINLMQACNHLKQAQTWLNSMKH